jgi:tRNA wybutosine-synthesizing protein 3
LELKREKECSKMGENTTVSATNRFSMVKENHKKSLEKAIAEKRADRQMVPLCKFVSGTKEFFTSSSCAGRIILLQLPKDENKKEASFHRKWHRKVREKELWQGIKAETKGELWFKLDSFILHIGAGYLEDARKILGCMKKAGVRRGGIIVAKPGKFLVEMQGTQTIAFPVKKGKEVLVGKDFMKYNLDRANKKLAQNYEMLKRLEDVFRQELK